ncbi:MAG: (2Fe-2S)-binding protein, partial [Caldilinea sp.]|nr:(2Fe-2S)-binding protein [Caldilinea sp.]MDW8439309.1 (2Fe-2S)-binding protein [Caldilineaceae bacterium]
MNIHLTLNGVQRTVVCEPGETLLSVLRRNGVWSVKHGCETGECGACSVLLDGKLTPTCVVLAAQADGHTVETVEALDRGPGAPLHPIQQAFAETGAIQCGYCTPAMVLAAQELLSRTLTPGEAEIRDALGGVLCRCTGYVKPVEAVQRAAAILRGEAVPPIDAAGGVPLEGFFDAVRRPMEPDLPGPGDNVLTKPKVALFTFPTVDLQGATEVVGKPEVKVDA